MKLIENDFFLNATFISWPLISILALKIYYPYMLVLLQVSPSLSLRHSMDLLCAGNHRSDQRQHYKAFSDNIQSVGTRSLLRGRVCSPLALEVLNEDNPDQTNYKALFCPFILWPIDRQVRQPHPKVCRVLTLSSHHHLQWMFCWAHSVSYFEMRSAFDLSQQCQSAHAWFEKRFSCSAGWKRGMTTNISPKAAETTKLNK